MLRPIALAASAVALAASLAACDRGASGASCPGERVAQLHFQGTRVAAGDAAIADLDPSKDLPDCDDVVGYPPAGAALPEFDAVLAHDPVTAAAALCKPGDVVLYGVRTGTQYTVETGTTGAVLGGCAATCTAGMRLVVAGRVEAGADGQVTGFTGGVFETMSAIVESACGTCSVPEPGAALPRLPCEARYTVTGG